MKIIDLHCDTIMRFYNGEHLDGLEKSHISLEKLKKGETTAQCFAIFVPTHESARREGLPDDPAEYFEKAYNAYLRELELNSRSIRPALTAADIEKNEAEGYISSILTVEDGVTLDGKIENVDDYYRRGVRMVALTWNYENSLGFPQSSDPKLHMLGLKPFGIECVRRMNELGIAVDVSHLSEGGFWDVARHTSRPFIASHSCARALCDVGRNLTDEQLIALADKGGVVGINYCDAFLKKSNAPKRGGSSTISDVIDHMRHIVNVAGVETVALGSDYDGIGSVLEWGDCGGQQRLAEAIAGEFGASAAEKICKGNALRAFRDIIGE